MQKTVQWYPGHMFKAKKEIITQLKNIDLVIEVIDSRVPLSSHNVMLEELTEHKEKLLIFTKADMVDRNVLGSFVDLYESKGYQCEIANVKSTREREKIVKKIYEVSSGIKEKYAKKGINKTIRILVMGMPNVGKSTLINFLAEKKKTEVGNRPGVTKQQQWIMVGDDIELLDTPGILVPKIEDIDQGYRLVLCSLIKDEVVHLDDVAIYLLNVLYHKYYKQLKIRYKFKNDIDYDIEALYDSIARSIGALLPGHEYDYERVSKTLIQDFRNEKFGKIILDEKQTRK